MTTLTLRDTGVTDTQLSKNTPTTQFGTAQSFYVGAATLAKLIVALSSLQGSHHRAVL